MYGQDIIVRYLQDAEAAERTFEDALASLSKAGDQPEVQSALAGISRNARSRHERLHGRLEALGAGGSSAKSALAHVLAFAPELAQWGETEDQKSTQDLMIVIGAAAAESAMYEALATAAAAAGDPATETLARQLQDEERRDYQQAQALLRRSAVETFQRAMNDVASQTPSSATH